MTSAKTFDNLNIKDAEYWGKLEVGFDRILHKLKPHNIINILSLFDRELFRGSPEFFAKLITIMPIHVERLDDNQLIKLIKICLSQNLVNDRLFKYFIYPKIENRADSFSFENYIEILNLLAELGFQEDQVFWTTHVLPATFKFQYSYDQAVTLWESFIKIRVNCPNVDIAKYVFLIENIISQFDNLKNLDRDISEITLRMNQDLELIPERKSNKLGLSKIKEMEKRMKDKTMMQGIFKDLGLEKTGSKQGAKVEESLNKMYDVKDWKKARFEASQPTFSTKNFEETQQAQIPATSTKDSENVVSNTTIDVESSTKPEDIVPPEAKEAGPTAEEVTAKLGKKQKKKEKGEKSNKSPDKSENK